MIIADTDVLIDFLNGKPPGSDWVAQGMEQGDLWITSITRFEILSEKKPSKKAMELVSLIRTLPLDETAADEAAKIRRSLESKGQDIGMADSLIAGIALSNKASLITRNHKHFGRVEGLKLTHKTEERE